jgi:hypothetical protein
VSPAVPPEVLEHYQRREGRLHIAEAAVGKRDVSDLEREVLGRPLPVGQGFGCTHDVGELDPPTPALEDAALVIWLPPGESTYHGAPKPVEPCPVAWPDAVSPVNR